MKIIKLNDFQQIDYKIISVVALLLMGIHYLGYSTYQHFKAVKQVSEGNHVAFDLSILFDWSMSQYKNDIVKSCNLNNIQLVIKSEAFQNANRFLELDVPLKQQGQYVERLDVYPSQDLKACILKVYFKNTQEMSSDIAGKYLIRQYFIQKERSYCLTNIQNRRLVKGCQRVSEDR